MMMKTAANSRRMIARGALAMSLGSFPLFIGLLVLTTAGNATYPPDWLSWFSLLLPLTGVGLAVYALTPQRGEASRRAAWAALLVGGISFLLVRGAAGILLESLNGELETRPIGELRSLFSAEGSYSSANGGHFGEPRCLVEPSSCIPGYDGPPFLGAEWATATDRSVWRFVFEPGSNASSGGSEGTVHARVLSYVFLVVPIRTTPSRLERLLDVRPLRSFCGDSTGRICRTRAGQLPPASDGRCAHADPAYENCYE